jgi:hypothetical protein
MRNLFHLNLGPISAINISELIQIRGKSNVATMAKYVQNVIATSMFHNIAKVRCVLLDELEKDPWTMLVIAF